jgi:uncharacterized protein
MSQALTLYRLQQIDSQTDRAQARLDIIQKILMDDASLREALQQAELTAAEQSAAELNQEKVEAEIHALRIKIDQTESSLYGGLVRNPKELQDLQNESAALKRYLVTLEDRLLEIMDIAEQAQMKNKDARSSLTSVQQGLAGQNQNLGQEQASLNRETQKLLTERLAITGSLQAGQIDLYEQLRQQHHGLAVWGIQDNSCLACGSTLTLAQVQAARSPGQLSRCPTCGRILYGNV